MKVKRRISVIVGILILVAYLMLFSISVSPMVGLFTEIISGAAVIGIAILMMPSFKDLKLKIPYLLLKAIEGFLMFAAGIFVLIQDITMYDRLYAIHVYAFSISAIFFYILLNKTRLIPKFINIWGIIAAVLVLSANIYTQLGFELPVIGQIIGYAPIILNEAFLAFWLMIKGFNKGRTLKNGN